MKQFIYRSLSCILMTLMVLWAPLAIADDIDLFVGASAGAAGNANVLVVFDNTSNWSRNSQHFVGISSVGQMEATVAAQVVSGLTDTSINVGVMEYVTGSGNINPGGFVRSAIKPMNVGTNQSDLVAKLNTMASNVNDPDEKLNSNIPYGGLMYDIYNYLGGKVAWASAGAIPSSVDSSGYMSTAHTQFRSPLSCDTVCAKTYVIFISNPDSNGPEDDESANTSALLSAGGNTVQLPLPNVTEVPVTSQVLLGTPVSSYANLAACQAAVNNANSVTVSKDGVETSYTTRDDYPAGFACESCAVSSTSTTTVTTTSTSSTGLATTSTVGSTSSTTSGTIYGTWSDTACVPSTSCPTSTISGTQYQCVSSSSCHTGELMVQSRSQSSWGAWTNCYDTGGKCATTGSANTKMNTIPCAVTI